jgi:hypothetical protein
LFYAIFSGYVFKDQFLGLGSNYFQVALYDLRSLNDAEFLPVYIKLVPLVGTILILGGAYYLSAVNSLYLFELYGKNKAIYKVFIFLSHK